MGKDEKVYGYFFSNIIKYRHSCEGLPCRTGRQESLHNSLVKLTYLNAFTQFLALIKASSQGLTSSVLS